MGRAASLLGPAVFFTLFSQAVGAAGLTDGGTGRTVTTGPATALRSSRMVQAMHP